jgi:hypothetical protein
MSESVKVRENRLRRMADRQGLRFVKSRSRDPQALDFGLYALVDVSTNGVVNPPIAGRWICSWDLDEVEEYLRQPEEP